jgi:hypothetical protein
VTRDEYFRQDIIERLQQVQHALDRTGVDPVVFEDGDMVLGVDDVLHDAIVAIRRLRGELAPELAAKTRSGREKTRAHCQECGLCFFVSLFIQYPIPLKFRVPSNGSGR